MGKIKDWLNEIKYFVQRGQRGWSDRDTWDLDQHLSTVIPEMVRHLKDNSISHPSDLTQKKWVKTLERIAKAFELMGLDSGASLNPRKLTPYEKGLVGQGFADFKKWYNHLWD